MRSPILGVLLIVSCLLASLSRSQNVNPEMPREVEAQHNASPEEARDRISDAQLQKDTKELAEQCSSLKPELDAVQKGMTGKDVLEKLKRVEKLSKRVREQLARVPSASN